MEGCKAKALVIFSRFVVLRHVSTDGSNPRIAICVRFKRLQASMHRFHIITTKFQVFQKLRYQAQRSLQSATSDLRLQLRYEKYSCCYCSKSVLPVDRWRRKACLLYSNLLLGKSRKTALVIQHEPRAVLYRWMEMTQKQFLFRRIVGAQAVIRRWRRMRVLFDLLRGYRRSSTNLFFQVESPPASTLIPGQVYRALTDRWRLRSRLLAWFHRSHAQWLRRKYG